MIVCIRRIVLVILKPLYYYRLLLSHTRVSSLQRVTQNPKNLKWKEEKCHATNTQYMQQQKSCNVTICSTLRFRIKHIPTLWKFIKHSTTKTLCSRVFLKCSLTGIYWNLTSHNYITQLNVYNRLSHAYSIYSILHVT